jgi:hypothetical protein
VRPALVLAAIVAGLVVAPLIAFGAAKSRPQHGTPPTQQTQQHHRKAQTAPAVSI